ncbi:MAG: GNAT family N-acetyltransferase [Filimonas sp.]|nr:GNAT family N-acetyltransferase [Filimonas sp.]
MNNTETPVNSILQKQNLDNLISLWLKAAEPFKAWHTEGKYQIIDIPFSQWPNRIWLHEGEEIDSTTFSQVKQASSSLTLSTWSGLHTDENILARELDLTLKSIQIGMSMPLAIYTSPAITDSLLFEKVTDHASASLWSSTFEACFKYNIPTEVIFAIKDAVTFSLLKKEKEVVGTIATWNKDGHIGVHSLGILPTHRKMGLAEIAMHQVLQQAQQEQLVNAHLQSSVMGLNIYKKIGFIEIFKMANYLLK